MATKSQITHLLILGGCFVLASVVNFVVPGVVPKFVWYLLLADLLFLVLGWTIAEGVSTGVTAALRNECNLGYVQIMVEEMNDKLTKLERKL
jgi:hypothetical protein